MAGWFSSVTQFVDNTFDSVLQQVNLATSELESEQAKFATQVASERGTVDAEASSLLPWETNEEALQILCNDAMERMLKLSVTEENFTVEPRQLSSSSASSNATDTSPTFNFTSFVPIALRLLELDPNLGHMHSKLMPRMDEVAFWRHYHYRVMYIRAAIGLDGPGAQRDGLGSQKEEDVPIFMPQYRAPPTATASASSASGVEMAVLAHSSSEVGGAAHTPARATPAPAPAPAAPVELTEEEKKDVLAKQRRREEAALAAEVEAELLGEDLDLGDLDDLGDLGDLGDLDDLGLLEEEEEDSPPTAPVSAAAKGGLKIDSNAQTPVRSSGDKPAGTGTGTGDEDDIDSNLGVLSLDELDELVVVASASANNTGGKGGGLGQKDAGAGTAAGAVDASDADLDAAIEAELAASPDPSRKAR